MLEGLRQCYQPRVPKVLSNLTLCSLEDRENPSVLPEIVSLFPKIAHQPTVFGGVGQKKSFSPLKVGVVFSGGPAPGGHNVVAGLLDGIGQLHPDSRLIGFLGGPQGLIQGKSIELTDKEIAPYRNVGGFDLLGTGRTKIETQEQFEACHRLHLDALVIIGGDDSNTSAALLAQSGPTPIIGIPKTIDGDLQNGHVAISFGFDTATKTYAALIGDIARDALSMKKYTHFIRLMGRNASHVTLECALATHPNLTFLTEEKKPFEQIVKEIADMVMQRSQFSKEYGVVLLSEGLADVLPLQQERPIDSHGNLTVSSVETELFLIQAVETELKKRGFQGKFQPVRHFLGYEGRCSFPTNFDANYSYALGKAAAVLAAHRKTGVMAFISSLEKPPEDWGFGAVPLSSLMRMETRKGTQKPVIAKTFVNLQGTRYQTFREQSPNWILNDDYQHPGPIQFFGDPLLTDAPPKVLNN